MLNDRLADKLAYSFTRVKRGEGVLEYHLHFLAQRTHFLTAQLGDILTVKNNIAGGRLNELQNAATCSGFATARFTYNAQGASLFDFKAYTVNSMQQAVGSSKVFRKVLYL